MHAQASYHTVLEQPPHGPDLSHLAEQVYMQVFRTDFSAPGLALVSFRQDVDSIELRQGMVTLQIALGEIHRQQTRHYLNVLSILRFDQQTTTRFHLDGAPDESYLMLGYEPSGVQSALCMADYTRAAYDLAITPRQFLSDYNPMFVRGEQQLVPYTTRLEGFDTRGSHILLVNNSRLPFCPDGTNTLGVMHQATILTPDPLQSRVVNSIMLAVSDVEDGPMA